MTENYLNPTIPIGLQRRAIPICKATNESLRGYGVLVTDPEQIKVEIVRWPAQGWRPVDLDSGDEAGTTEGVFCSEWRGDFLFGTNEAVMGHYVVGFAQEPQHACNDHQRSPDRILLWHANYHPDGGQLFFPLDKARYLLPLALPGDDVRPDDFICFLFEADQGCCIHPNVWHEAVFPLKGKQSFLTRQGRVHARVSVQFAFEFECLLEIDVSSLAID